MLTVWAVWYGPKYPEHYVRRLRNMVRRNLLMPHEFRVLTDQPLAGISTVSPPCAWPGWWQKLGLFAPGVAQGRNLYLDLDSVILAPLDPLVMRHADDALAMPRNWAQSGHDSCQSSVMIWQGGAFPELFTGFDAQRDQPRLWGDQEWITERLGKPGEGVVTPIAHPAVVSYKYHCRDGPPPGAVVATFHGEPKPANVEDAWVKSHWW